MESMKKKGGGGVKYIEKKIPRVSDVICSSCTRQEAVIMFYQSRRLYQAERRRAGQLSGLYLLNTHS